MTGIKEKDQKIQIHTNGTSSNGHNGAHKNGSTEVKVAYIDNKAYEVKDGETILSFVRRNLGKDLVPTLCDAPNLEPFGSCRHPCAVQEDRTLQGSTSHHAHACNSGA